jgi:(2Fe-2S) ferredoxin
MSDARTPPPGDPRTAAAPDAAATPASPRLVYVCEGGDCSEKGSIEIYEDLKATLHERDTAGINRLRKYPCFGGCEHGINMVLFPDRCFYSKVTTDDLPEIVDHLVGDGPKVERLTGKVPKDVEDITYDLLTTGF